MNFTYQQQVKGPLPATVLLAQVGLVTRSSATYYKLKMSAQCQHIMPSSA